MKRFNIKDMKGGWFIGDFDPAVYKTNKFEVCYKKHPKGEEWPVHYHKKATEINYLIKGQMSIQGSRINPGDIFILEPYELADPIFLEDCELIVVKTPSFTNDKYEVCEVDNK